MNILLIYLLYFKETIKVKKGILTVTCLINTFLQVEECLNLWNDRDHGGTATRNDLIDTLTANQRHNNCHKLISKLKLIGSGMFT